MMTFQQFQATRKWSDDLGLALNDARWEDGDKETGQLYLDCLYIESAIHIEGATGEYVLTIGNEITFGPIETLEHNLYNWATAEGYCE